jgi:predicted nucleic acid-binding protein
LAQTLILDSEAVNALANPGKRGTLTERARAMLHIVHDTGALVRVPAPVLAEVCRGGNHDAALLQLLNGKGIGVVSLSAAIARRAGSLLAKHRLSSAHAIDAFVVATAMELGPAVIATGDTKDITRLASSDSRIRVFRI